jgi:XTP/dITP diphosphohydrolase
MKIVLASNNRGKLAELQAMLAPLGIELVRQADLGVGEAAEPFRTFVENALAKARHAARTAACRRWPTTPACVSMPLVVCPAWTRPTTPRSLATKRRRQQRARAAGADAGHRQPARRHGQHPGRRAQPARPRAPDRRGPRGGRDHAREPRGSNGFGFDPVMFIPEFGQTFAELPHRGQKRPQPPRPRRAAMVELMRERWNSPVSFHPHRSRC